MRIRKTRRPNSLDYVTVNGGVLLQLCSIANTYGADIQIRQVEGRQPGERMIFEIQLNRDKCYSVARFDITPGMIGSPEEAARLAFEKALWGLKREVYKTTSEGAQNND